MSLREQLECRFSKNNHSDKDIIKKILSGRLTTLKKN